MEKLASLSLLSDYTNFHPVNARSQYIYVKITTFFTVKKCCIFYNVYDQQKTPEIRGSVA